MSEIILETEKLQKKYESKKLGSVEVLKGIDFQLHRQSVCYILGHSGVGKSTLLHLMGGLDRPSSGDVIFDGRSLGSMSDRELAHFRNREVGFVFQFYHLLPELTLLENVVLPSLIARKSNGEKKALELIDRVGLSDRIHHLPSQLSGGEQQRAAVARALINNPKIVFCDEPTGNLDEGNSRVIYDLITSLSQQNGLTFCIVTHEESYVKGKDNVYRLTNGCINSES